MKFEVNKRILSRKSIFIGIIVLAIIVLVLLFNKSYAKYSSIKTIHLVNGVVNYTKEDFGIVAMYKNDGDGDIATDRMPTGGYTINQDKSYCSVNGNKDTEAKIYTDSSSKHIIENLAKGSKCYLYFDKGSPFVNKMLTNQNGGNKGKLLSFSSSPSVDEAGIYESEDDYGISYYFRGYGESLNNWVMFAGYYWRIIRINGNGSIRMIYSGVANGLPGSSNERGTTTQINNKTYIYNSLYNDNAYVGYMHGINSGNSSTYEQAHTNTFDIQAKIQVDDWFKTNIKDKGLGIFLDNEAGFCNDRTTTNDGYGKVRTNYAPIDRKISPTLKCPNKDNDLFTVSGSSVGNKKLTYPVGLITGDESVYAGYFSHSTATISFLDTQQDYWTMSPSMFGGTSAGVEVIVGGTLRSEDVNKSYGIRPVVNLLPNVITSGDGSKSNPYLTD